MKIGDNEFMQVRLYFYLFSFIIDSIKLQSIKIVKLNNTHVFNFTREPNLFQVLNWQYTYIYRHGKKISYVYDANGQIDEWTEK